MPKPTSLNDLTESQLRAVQAIVDAAVKKTRKRRMRFGEKTRVITIAELKRRAWLAESKLVENGHSLDVLESLEADIREVRTDEGITREEIGWLRRWKRDEKGTVWILTPWGAFTYGKNLGEHWEYTSIVRPRKNDSKPKKKQADANGAASANKQDMVKVRTIQEVPEWRTGDPLEAPKGSRPIYSPRFKGECELADWMIDEQPSRELSPEDQAIAAEEVLMRDAVKEDGRLDIDENTQKVRREPVRIWGEPVPLAKISKKKSPSSKPKPSRTTPTPRSSPPNAPASLSGGLGASPLPGADAGRKWTAAERDAAKSAKTKGKRRARGRR